MPRTQHPALRIVALALALGAAILVGTGADAGPNFSAGGTGTAVGGFRITPTPLDFGVVAKGSSTSKDLTLSNNALDNVTIGIPLGTPNTPACNAFTVTPTPALPDTLFPTDTRTWPVTFHPMNFGSFDCSWNLNT